MKWVLDTILWVGWCCIIMGIIFLILVPMALSEPGWGEPLQLVGTSLLLLPTAAVCFVIVKSRGKSLDPFDGIIKIGKGWRERTLAEKKEWVQVWFAMMRGVWLAGAYICMFLWIFSSSLHSGSLLPGMAGVLLALFSGMVLAEAVLHAVFIERPVFAKSGLYIMTFFSVAAFCIVKQAECVLDGLDNCLIGIILASILAITAVAVRFAHVSAGYKPKED